LTRHKTFKDHFFSFVIFFVQKNLTFPEVGTELLKSVHTDNSSIFGKHRWWNVV